MTFSALTLQKYVRGWMIRKKTQTLKKQKMEQPVNNQLDKNAKKIEKKPSLKENQNKINNKQILVQNINNKNHSEIIEKWPNDDEKIKIGKCCISQFSVLNSFYDIYFVTIFFFF